MSTRRSLPRLLAALACVATVALSGCTISDSGKTFRYTGATATGTVLPQQKRKDAFDIEGSTLNGPARASLAADKGKVTVIPFWASWCGPCRVEMPLLQNVQTHYGTKVAFLGVNFKDDRDSAKSFLDSFGISFPNVFDETGRNVIKLGNSPAGPPFTMLVDKSGRVAAFYVGRYAELDLTRAIDTLRAES